MPESPYRAPLPVKASKRRPAWLRVGIAVAFGIVMALSLAVMKARQPAAALAAERRQLDAELRRVEAEQRQLQAELRRFDPDGGSSRGGPGDYPIWIPKAPWR